MDILENRLKSIEKGDFLKKELNAADAVFNQNVDKLEEMLDGKAAAEHVHSAQDVGAYTKSESDKKTNAVQESVNAHSVDTTRHLTNEDRNTWSTVTNKVDKVSGKQLSTEDYTSAEKVKLAGMDAGANKYTLPVAGAALGGVKSGTDISVDAAGNVSVVDDSHNHIIDNVDELQGMLDGKAAEGHKHVKADVTDFPATMPPTAHKATHKAGGSDALTAADVGAVADAAVRIPLTRNILTSPLVPNQLYATNPTGSISMAYGYPQDSNVDVVYIQASGAGKHILYTLWYEVAGSAWTNIYNYGTWHGWKQIRANPSLHKETHKTGGSDALTAADVGGMATTLVFEDLADYAKPIDVQGDNGRWRSFNKGSLSYGDRLLVEYRNKTTYYQTQARVESNSWSYGILSIDAATNGNSGYVGDCIIQFAPASGSSAWKRGALLIGVNATLTSFALYFPEFATDGNIGSPLQGGTGLGYVTRIWKLSL